MPSRRDGLEQSGLSIGFASHEDAVGALSSCLRRNLFTYFGNKN